MASVRSNDLLQLGHFLIRFAIRLSTQLLQKTWPHPLRIVFLKLLRQTEQITRVWTESVSREPTRADTREKKLTLSASSSSDELLWHLVFHLLQSLVSSLTSTLAFSRSVSARIS